jgi:hypothetical protein
MKPDQKPQVRPQPTSKADDIERPARRREEERKPDHGDDQHDQALEQGGNPNGPLRR